MKTGLHVLLVSGDGARVLRCRIPQWLAYGAPAVVAAAVATTAGVADEYVRARSGSGQVAALSRRVDQQRLVIERFKTQIAEANGEIGRWSELRARMWRAFHPDADGTDAPMPERDGASIPDAVGAGGQDELALLTTRIAEEGPRLRALERMLRRTGKAMRTLPLRWPIRGPVNSEYGVRRSPWTGARAHHAGIDIGTAPGSPVQSPAPGTVTAAAFTSGYGRHVRVDHGNGVSSLYGHLQRIDVKVGQQVEAGRILGLAGSTGRSTGPHLHYEVRVDGKPVDPRPFLQDDLTSPHPEQIGGAIAAADGP